MLPRKASRFRSRDRAPLYGGALRTLPCCSDPSALGPSVYPEVGGCFGLLHAMVRTIKSDVEKNRGITFSRWPPKQMMKEWVPPLS